MEITCQVMLSNSQEVYYPGQTVSGFVESTFPAEERIRGLRVKLRGKEHTDDVKRKQYFDSVENQVKYKKGRRRTSNIFLEIVQTLIGEGTMLMGMYKYPFSFNLPIDIPCSYQGTYAYIQYYIKANVDIPFEFDPRGTVYFDVHSPINFHTMISQLPLNPITYQNQKTLGFCCWASEPITMAVHLQKEAFVEGEIVGVIVDVTNMADENVDQIRVKITRTIEAMSYNENYEYKKEKVILASAVETGVGAKGQRNYYFNLTIPRPGAVYNLTRCQNLKQWFTLSVKAVLPNLHRNMKIKTKLILGHLPLGGLGELHGDATLARLSPNVGLPPPYTDNMRESFAYS